jgi:hypothetical protein
VNLRFTLGEGVAFASTISMTSLIPDVKAFSGCDE